MRFLRQLPAVIRPEGPTPTAPNLPHLSVVRRMPFTRLPAPQHGSCRASPGVPFPWRLRSPSAASTSGARRCRSAGWVGEALGYFRVMQYRGARTNTRRSTILFSLLDHDDERRATIVPLKSIGGPDDDGSPCVRSSPPTTPGEVPRSAGSRTASFLARFLGREAATGRPSASMGERRRAALARRGGLAG